MGRLRDFLEEAAANINPFDNGANASTVVANRNKVRPAQTPAPGASFRPSLSSSQPTTQQQPTVQQPRVTPVNVPTVSLNTVKPQGNFLTDTVNNVGNLNRDIINNVTKFGQGFANAGAIDADKQNFTKDQFSTDTATRLGQTLNGSLQAGLRLGNNNFFGKSVLGLGQGAVVGAGSVAKQFQGENGNNYTQIKNPLLQQALDTKEVGDFQGEGQHFVNDAPSFLKPALDNDVAKNVLGATGAVLNLLPGDAAVRATGKVVDAGLDASKLVANRTGQVARDVAEAPRESVLNQIAKAGGEQSRVNQNLFNDDVINSIPTQGGKVDKYANDLFDGKDIGHVNITRDENNNMIPLTRDDANKLSAYRGVHNDTYSAFQGEQHPLSHIPVNEVDSNIVTRGLDLHRAQSQGGFVGDDGAQNFDDLLNSAAQPQPQPKSKLAAHAYNTRQLEQDMARANAPSGAPESSAPIKDFSQPTAQDLAQTEARQAGQAPVEPTSLNGIETPSSAESISPNANQTKVKLNTDRLNVDDASKAVIDDETTRIVNKMSNKDVEDLAKRSGIDYKSYGDEGTRKAIAEQLNLRKQLVEVTDARKAALASGDTAEAERLTALMGDMGRTSSSQGRNVARQLQARRIVADALKTPEQRLFKLLDLAGVEPDVAAKRLSSVDFDNADQVVSAYRDLVPAKFGDWLDKYRYTNMLSSPLTHIVNITSNAQGVLGIRPLQKAVEGGVDATRSFFGLGGDAPRSRFAGEAGAYYKGAFKSVPEALTNFKDVMTGKKVLGPIDDTAITNGRLATKGVLGKLDTVLSFVPKLLEASDQLGTTVAKSGELRALKYRADRGGKVPTDLNGFAEDAAAYTNFRQELGKSGQGPFLEALDAIPSAISKLRQHKNPIIAQTAKFTIPFVTTPANIFKQGLEYSPAGILTIPGSADKTAQAAKVAIGTSAVGIAAAAFAGNDAITFSEPSDSKQRDAFRAEGKQPYSIKIGNNWVAYSKLHPAIAFNLASVAAVKDAMDKGAIDQSTADKVLNSAAGVLGFFRDQSYMKSVGDFTNNLQIKDGATLQSNIAQITSNYANQLSPFKSMVSWLGRQVDPTQRKTNPDASVPEQIYQNIIKDIPGLNGKVPARKDPYTGGNLKNDNPILNSFSPVRITNDKGYGNTTGLTPEQRMMQQQFEGTNKETYRQGIIDQKYSATQEKDTTDKIKRALENGTPLSDVKIDNKSNSGTAYAAAGSDANKDDTIRQLPNGKFFTKVGDEYKTFDSQTKAKQALQSADEKKQASNFEDSNDRIREINGKVYYKTGTGEVKSKSKFDYEADKADSQFLLDIDRAKGSDNYDAWKKAAEGRFQIIQQKLQQKDPDTEQGDIADLTKKAEDLQDEFAKYESYGGLTKPKKGKSSKGGSSNGISYKIDGYGADNTTKSLRSLLASAKVTGSKKA